MKHQQKNEQPEDELFLFPPTDPLGSWTGVPEEPWEEPVQDADDL